MRLQSFIPLLELRRKLFWARTRSRSGKVAIALLLFLVGWVVLVLGLGGLSVGAVAARLGKGHVLADVAFGGAFLFSLFSALAFGLDNNPAFSDKGLRRYPLSGFERLAVRYAVGLFDPLWLCVLVLDLGLAAGFAAFGISAWWFAVPAAVLLFLTNYLAARLLVEVVGRIMATRGGSLLLMLGFVLLFFLPGAFMAARSRHGIHASEVVATLSFTPPLAAAKVVAGTSALASVGAMLVTLIWLLGVGFALVSLEGRPIRSTTVARAEATWESFYDRVVPAFGPNLGPMVGKVLRYYVRGPLFWLNFPLLAICPAFFAIQFARHNPDPRAGFLTMLGWVAFVGYGSAGAVGANVFGFDRSGFRRYFLLPLSPADVLRAAALVPLLLGGALILISAAVWLALWNGPFDTHMIAMLFSSGFGEMFFFQALALWTSLLSPHARELKFQFGNRMPLAQNVVMAGAIVVTIWFPIGLLALGSKAVLSRWWLAPLFLFAAGAFYFATLRAGGRVLRARRERMLAIIEGGA